MLGTFFCIGGFVPFVGYCKSAELHYVYVIMITRFFGV